MCFLIGNDFLPRVYCFDIKTGNFYKLDLKYLKILLTFNFNIILK